MRRSQGFSLIELMVAMLVGLIVVGGGIYVYVSSQRNLNEVHASTEVSENGRFALYVLSNALREAGFMGEVATSSIEVRADIPVGVGGDCFIRSSQTGPTDDWRSQISAEDLTTPVFVDFVKANEVLSSTQDKFGTTEGCLENLGANQAGFLPFEGKEGAHLLITKRVNANSISSAASVTSKYAIVSNHIGGALYDSGDLSDTMIQTGGEFVGGQFWEYEYEKFFVDDDADGIPTLYRQSMDTGLPEALVTGIEDIRIRINQRESSDKLGEFVTTSEGRSPTELDYSLVTVAEVFVLARSIDSINSSATNTARTYDIGGFSRTFDDGFKREVFTSTVTLRNPSMWALGEL